jgi:hypothetical protein
MSQFPAAPLAYPAHLPPPLPSGYGSQVSSQPRGPIGGPLYPYQPQSFSTLYLWWAIAAGVHVLVLFPCIILFPLHLLAFPIFVASVTMEAILLYKAWNQIQDGQQRTSPGKAVGYGFIPFFNFYWWFVAYQGLAEDLNSFTRKYGLNAPQISSPLAMVVCILSICKWLLIWVPGIGAMLAIAEAVVLFIFLQQVKLASMAVAQAKLTAASQAGTLPVR